MRLIDADALKDKWQNDLKDTLENGVEYIDNDIEDVYRWFAEDLESSPTIDPVKHGKWNDGKYMGGDGCFVWHRECSLCGYERDDDNLDKDTNYCPNCGAKMDGE